MTGRIGRFLRKGRVDPGQSFIFAAQRRQRVGNEGSDHRISAKAGLGLCGQVQQRLPLMMPTRDRHGFDPQRARLRGTQKRLAQTVQSLFPAPKLREQAGHRAVRFNQFGLDPYRFAIGLQRLIKAAGIGQQVPAHCCRLGQLQPFVPGALDLDQRLVQPAAFAQFDCQVVPCDPVGRIACQLLLQRRDLRGRAGGADAKGHGFTPWRSRKAKIEFHRWGPTFGPPTRWV